MSHILAILLELAIAFSISTSVIIALLRFAEVAFPLELLLRITGGWTLVAFAVLRAIQSRLDRTDEEECIVPEKRLLPPDATVRWKVGKESEMV
jgi:hypothetical protein